MPHEFVKYSGGDGSGLGIVLTPQHLTEFMCELADVNENSYVADICCGSGSFLVSAMNLMFKKTSDPKKLQNIREHQLHGIEFDQDLYLLSITNMIIRKDGKSNIIHGDCFSKDKINYIVEASKKVNDSNGNSINENHGLTVGLLNPPYSQKDKEELEFVEQLLSILTPNGKAVVVVPMSCAIGTKFKETRKRLFEKHTLKAVFTMPDDIFYPTGTNVCVMVWEAHKPHNTSVKTFFGYYKDDGFLKRKKIGRVDALGKWNVIKEEWLSLYRNSDVIDGLSAKECVKDNDEWLAEAYMKTDYSKLTNNDFEKMVRMHLSYLVFNGITDLSKNFDNENQEQLNLNDREWKQFKLSNLFKAKRGTRLKQEDRIEGNTPLVTAGESNLGVKDFIANDQEIFENKITIDMFCNTYVHIDAFCCDDNIITLGSGVKEEIGFFEMLFISTIISLDKYRYQYGRQYRMKNFNTHEIKLPIDTNGNPDWHFMKEFIKQLPYADRL